MRQEGRRQEKEPQWQELREEAVLEEKQGANRKREAGAKRSTSQEKEAREGGKRRRQEEEAGESHHQPCTWRVTEAPLHLTSSLTLWKREPKPSESYTSHRANTLAHAFNVDFFLR